MGMRHVVIGGIYRHYKTGDLYRVEMIARHTETEERLVIYKGNAFGRWARPLEMFTEIVEHEGKQVPRFERVS
jgi:hypothetical protein